MKCDRCGKKAKLVYVGVYPAWFCKNAKFENSETMVSKGLPSTNVPNKKVKSVLRDFRNMIYGIGLAVAVQSLFQVFLTFTPAGSSPTTVRWGLLGATLVALGIVCGFYLAVLAYVRHKYRIRIQFY